MDINEIASYAVELKTHRGYNCAQAVLQALKDETGLSDDELVKIGAGFCAGMGTMEATCGALIGANVAMGLKTGGNGTLRYSRMLVEEFKNACGALTCKDLKSRVDGRPLCPCEECVRNAVLCYFKVTDNLHA